MTIKFTDGRTQEGMLMTRAAGTMRVAIQGADDVLVLTERNDMWITEDCEPVQVTFAWSRPSPVEEMNEAGFICSPELAAHLIQLLYSGDEDPVAAPTANLSLAMAATAPNLVF